MASEPPRQVIPIGDHAYEPEKVGGGPTVIQPVSVVAVVQEFRNSPVETICPYCRRQIATAVTFEIGTFTWVVALVTFLIGCTLGCCFIPFCMDNCKDAIHTCPICNQQIFRWRRL